MSEKPITDMEQLVTRLVSVCKATLCKPYAVLGNSMGCWIGYEFIARMQLESAPLPLHFFACAAGPPHKKYAFDVDEELNIMECNVF
jgi:surfactin synthase thioesterase subunit